MKRTAWRQPLRLFFDSPGGEPFLFDLSVAFFQEGFLHGREVGRAVKDAEVFVAFGDLSIENFERLGVAIRDDNRGCDKAAHGFVASGEGVDEEEFCSL